MNEKIRGKAAKIAAALEIICSIVFGVIVHGSKLIPLRYEIVIGAVLILVLIAVIYFTIFGKNKILYWIFMVLSVLVSVALIVGGKKYHERDFEGHGRHDRGFCICL